MSYSKNALIIFVTLHLSVECLASEKFPGIENLMDKETFQKTGLDKQNDEELKALNAWLIKYTAKDAEHIKRNTKEVREAADTEIHSRIKGVFHGWSGDSTFALENGQIWKQRMSGRWKADIHSPEVVIKKNFFGFYVLEIKEKKKKIGVKRIE